MYKVISDDRGVFLINKVESLIGTVGNCIARNCDLMKADESEKVFNDIAERLNKPSFELSLSQQKIEELKQAMNMQSSVISQMLDTIQIALEEDDIDEALELVKSYQNN